MRRIREMHGLEIKELDTIIKYGYRGTLSKNEVCTICTEDGQEILKIEAFNELCKLRITTKEGKVTLADWAQIQPKQNRKGVNLFYERERLVHTKEFC